MYYYDKMLVWKQQREHFNSLPLDEFRKGNFFTVEQIQESCNKYLQEVFSLECLQDYEPSATMKDPQLSLFSDTQEFETGSREWIVYHEILGQQGQENLVSTYQKMLAKTLIFDVSTLPEVKKILLATNDKVMLLYNAQVMMREDDLDKFFDIDQIFTWDKVTPLEAKYLRDKLEHASVAFDDMRIQDKCFATLINKMQSDDDSPLDYQYQNLWNKKMAGWIKTPQEHLQIIHEIVATLEREDIGKIRGNSQLFFDVNRQVEERYKILQQQSGT